MKEGCPGGRNSMHRGSEVGKVGPDAEEEKPPWQPGTGYRSGSGGTKCGGRAGGNIGSCLPFSSFTETGLTLRVTLRCTK